MGLQAKACHQGLRGKSRIFGLEPVDGLVLFPALFVCVVVLKHLILGVAITVASALVLRLIKWGRLPGYSLDLALYLLLPSHQGVLGRDRAPSFPRD